jgi:hypothetical protein
MARFTLKIIVLVSIGCFNDFLDSEVNLGRTRVKLGNRQQATGKRQKACIGEWVHLNPGIKPRVKRFIVKL